MNVVVDIVRHSMRELYEEILLLFLSLNQNVDDFSRIHWRGTSTMGSGDVILSDIEAADWRNVLSIVQKSDVGFRLTPIKIYISEMIDFSLQRGDWERQQRFIERY